MEQTSPQRSRRILWPNVLTVVSAAILISAEVFGAAFAGSWAIANLLELGTLGARILAWAMEHPRQAVLAVQGAGDVMMMDAVTRALAKLGGRS